jgi:methyltransferase (TIGR00027 family)
LTESNEKRRVVETRRASSTARAVAVLRAAHRIIDGEPALLDDTIIARLIGGGLEAQIRSRVDELQTPLARGLRSHVLLRSRFAEDSLADAIAHGVAQYVLLGAGLDTFAYRQPAWAGGLTIVEVDHPASQDAKRAALDRAAIEIPPNVRFAPVDFELETLTDALVRGGVDLLKATFFSWLGVTMYLTQEAIEQTLRTVLAFPSGSEIVFTFAQPRSDPASPSHQLAAGAASVGEPWISYFEPEELETMLRSLGFPRVRFLTRDEAVRRYYTSRSDGLAAPQRISIVSAAV